MVYLLSVFNPGLCNGESQVKVHDFHPTFYLHISFRVKVLNKKQDEKYITVLRQMYKFEIN